MPLKKEYCIQDHCVDITITFLKDLGESSKISKNSLIKPQIRAYTELEELEGLSVMLTRNVNFNKRVMKCLSYL